MRIKCIGSKEVMVVLAVAVCLAMAGDIRFAVIGVL